MGISRAERLYRRLEELGIIDLLKQEVEHQKLENAGYMPLSYNWSHPSYYDIKTPPPWSNGREVGDLHYFILEHNFVQNGDLCVDPRIDFRVDMKNRRAEAISFEMAMPPVYQAPYQHSRGTTPFLTKTYRDINAFALTWTSNLLDQGFRFSLPQGAPEEAPAAPAETKTPKTPEAPDTPLELQDFELSW